MRRLRILAAWLVVGVPLAWGVARSVQKALPLLISTSQSTKEHTSSPKP